MKLPPAAPQILFYPTAIGSEPQDVSLNSYPHWTRVMGGHAGANLVNIYILLCTYLLPVLPLIHGSLSSLTALQVPLVASNRVGKEEFEKSSITFYGGSFIADQTGGIVQQVCCR